MHQESKDQGRLFARKMARELTESDLSAVSGGMRPEGGGDGAGCWVCENYAGQDAKIWDPNG